MKAISFDLHRLMSCIDMNQVQLEFFVALYNCNFKTSVLDKIILNATVYRKEENCETHPM